MATYTDNYQLTLPGYADVADVADINHNATIIDEIMHSSQISLADAYDSTQTYNAGDVVMYQYKMYKCITDGVTGTWDPTKWERTTAAETGGSSDPDYYGTASGDPASFADGAAAGLVKCETDLEPVQDLHGYDKPWVGGAGKNKLNITATTTIENGVTFTINTDSDGNVISIVCNGTPTLGNASLRIGVNEAIGNDCILTGAPTGGSLTTFLLYVDGTLLYDMGSGVNIPSTETHADISISIRSGYTADNLTFYPMLRLSTEPSGFEPYANICPISGHNSATITVSPTSDPAQGTTKTIPFGSTVYGGTLDVTNGELTVTKRIITENDFTMMGGGTSGGGLNYFQIPSTEPQATSGEAISNMLEQNQSGWSSTAPCFSTNTGASPNIYPVRVYAASSSLANFKTEYSGLQIVYTLATPQTVQLTPAQVASVLGQNYVSSDTGAVDVIYIKNAAPIIPNATGDSSGDLNSIGLGGKIFTIPKELPALPAADGAYKLRVTVTDGAPTFSWVSDT